MGFFGYGIQAFELLVCKLCVLVLGLWGVQIVGGGGCTLKAPKVALF